MNAEKQVLIYQKITESNTDDFKRVEQAKDLTKINSPKARDEALRRMGLDNNADFRDLPLYERNAAARTLETSYSKFMGSLKKNGVALNRKMLAEIAATDFVGFTAIKNSLKK
jgi:ribosomal protein L20